MDGNFTASHIRKAGGIGDVWLTNGEGMMTNRSTYQAYLATATEPDIVRPRFDLITAKPYKFLLG